MRKSKRIISILLATVFVFGSVQMAHADTAEPDIIANAAILIEHDSGRVIYAKNEHQKMYPASTTKLLTALTALDYLKPDDKITTGSEVYSLAADSSIGGIKSGETFTVDEILHAMLIPSGSDAANTIALNTAEVELGETDIPFSVGEKEFSNLMNQKAEELGCTESNFTNPTGYQDENHYTTAYDMSIIANACLDNDEIKSIVSLPEYTVSSQGYDVNANGGVPEYDWINTNELIVPDSGYTYPGTNGMKTGFTDEAGDCVVASAVKDGVDLLAVIFDSDEAGRWEDAQKLFDYGFSNYDMSKVQSADDVLEQVNLSGSDLNESKTLDVSAGEDFSYYMTPDEVSQVESTVTYDDSLVDTKHDGDSTIATTLVAPIAKGQQVGTITYSLSGTQIYSGPVVASRDVNKTSLGSDIKYIFSNVFSVSAIPFWIAGIVIIILIFFIVRRIRVLRNRRRRTYKFKKR